MSLSFEQDNFRERRASQAGAGVGYDPESLLTEQERLDGFDYGDLRSWPNEETRQLAYAGNIPVDIIPTLAPRVKRSAPEDFSGYTDWHSAAQAEIDAESEPRFTR
jgi:hypothetical protein